MRATLVALFLGALAAGTAWGQGWESTVSRTYPYDIPTPLADHPSPFVHVPARLGFYTGMLAGLVPGAMVGVPLALVERAAKGQVSQSTADVIQMPAVYSGVGMHYVAGAPFFMTKVVMWDIPRAALGWDRGRRNATLIQRSP